MTKTLSICAVLALATFFSGIIYEPVDAKSVGVIYEPIVYEAKEDPVVETTIIEITEPTEEDLKIASAQAQLDEIESIDSNIEWYKEYKKIIEEYSDYIDAPESIYDVYTDDEINIMCRVIETEVHGATFDAKVNVASVLLNRIEHEKFGDDPYEVCTAPGQFAYSKTNINEETLLALEYAYQITDPTSGALYFRSDKSPATWNGKQLIMHDGYHAFYG